MAQVANLKSNIQSKIQQDVNEKKKQLSASSTATQAWSTETPKVTDTPKVTQTAKAMPSVTPKLDLTPVSQATVWAGTTTTPTVNAKDLLSVQTPTLRKAATPDLLSKTTEQQEVKNTTIPLNIVKASINVWWQTLKAVSDTLYQQWLDRINDKIWKLEQTRKDVTDKVWKYAIDMFKGVWWDIAEQWTSGEWIWMVRDTVANTLEWLPRWITRIEYWLAEIADWWIDAKWLDDVKKNIESNLDYWENTRVYKRASSVEWVWDFLKNPFMYAGWTLWEMLPFFVSPWVAIPWTYAQIYWETYMDYANDESLQDLSDNQIRLMATWVATVNTIIEIWADLFQAIMPWAKTSAKVWEKEVRKALQKPLSRIIRTIARWGGSEWLEEVLQDEILNQVAWFMGSDRDMPTWADRITTFLISSIVWSILQWWNVVVDVKQNKELESAYNEWSEAVDEIAPWVSKEDKQRLFSAIVAAQVEDANMSEKLVNKYEVKTTELYNKIDELNKQLETETNEEKKTEINRQIEDANQKIKDIDEIINKGNKVMEDVNKQLQELSQKEELPATEYEIQLPKEVGWENLSKQTMKIVEDSAVSEVTQPTQSEIQYKEAIWEAQTPTRKYINNMKKLSSKTISYAESSKSWGKREFILKDDLVKQLKNMSEDEWWELLSHYDAYSLTELLNLVKRTLKNVELWKNTRIKPNQLLKLANQISKWNELRNQMIEENRKIINNSQLNKEEAEWLNEYKLISWISDHESAKSQFIKQNTLYWKHLVWLKNINIKKLEWKITDGVAHKFGLILAKASQILWIDFNKVIWDNEFNVTVWYKDNVSWQFVREFTKWALVNLLEKIQNEWKYIKWYNSLMEDMFKSGIYLATLDNLSTTEAAATLVHEFMHLLDYKRAVDLKLQARENPHYRIDDNRQWTPVFDAEYTLDWDKRWETFNNPEDIKDSWFTKSNHDTFNDLMAWNIQPSQISIADKIYANNMLYIYDPTEILSRYAEQYYMWKEDKELFDEYSKKAWYWTEEEFKKLIDTFEKTILQGEFAKYQIDEWNRNYHDLMVKLDEYKYNQTLLSDKKWLEQIKNNNPQMQQEAAQRMMEMQKQYIELANELDNLEWTISEEVKAEYATELDDLATNMWILEQTLQDYMNFVDKRVPMEDFEAADNVLEQENLEQDHQEIEEEDASHEDQSAMENDMEEQIEEAWGIQNINEWRDRESEYQWEKKTQKEKERHRNLVESRDSIWDVAKDILTPTMSRIYNINRRVAWRLTQMETQTWINIYRYTQKCQWFVNQMNTLQWEAKLEVTEALLNFWALASEQWENIEQYKKDEVAKLKEVLLRNWFKEQDINDMFSVLNDLWNRYRDSWLSINLSDMYFPRVVKDYSGLIEYMSRVSWTEIEDKTKDRLMRDIQEIIDNPSYSDEEKEKRIRSKLTMQFPQWIKTGSKHSKERKLWKLSDWWAGIYAYYEDPTISLAHYITTMENAIQRQIFLGWQAKDLWLDIDTINSSNEESVSSIVKWLAERGDISTKEINELQKCIIAVMDKKHTPRWIQRVKDLTYVMALTNYISAINQMEDIWVAIIENKWWLMSTLKSIFTKAWIKYDEAWLESAYEMFKSEVGISNKLFAMSGFNFTDRLGKKCFLNAAWNSMVKRAKNDRSRQYLVERLTAMYWEKTAENIMKRVDAWNYMVNWQIDIDVLTDLLYQLGTTQPIYASAMPVWYLRSPSARWFYALSMFSIRQADHIIQSTKQTYQEKWLTAAAIWGFWIISMRMFFGALVWDVGDWFQWKWEEETWLWQLLSKWWDEAWQQFKEDYLKSFSKLWMLSDYDKDTFKKDWVWWIVANKMYPYVIQEAHKLRKATERAFKNDDPTELVPMLRDVPLIWKQVAAWWMFYLEESTKKSESWLVRRKDWEWLIRRKEEEWLTRRKDEWLIRRK